MENPMVNYSRIIADTAKNHYNVHDKYKDNTIDQNVEIQKSQSRKFSVGCINITGELNIGMMIRSACLFGAEKFYIFGRKKFDKRSTVGAENYIEIVQYTYDDPMTADERMAEDIRNLQDTKHSLYVCEQSGRTLTAESWIPSGIRKLNYWVPTQTNHQYSKTTFEQTNPLFLFGSESHGVPQTVIDLVTPDCLLSIPQVGVLRSFNVASAMNIIVWDYIKEVYL